MGELEFWGRLSDFSLNSKTANKCLICKQLSLLCEKITYFNLSEQASSAHARVQVSQNLMCLSGSRHSSQAVLYCTMSYLLREGGVPPPPAAVAATHHALGRTQHGTDAQCCSFSNFGETYGI